MTQRILSRKSSLSLSLSLWWSAGQRWIKITIWMYIQKRTYSCTYVRQRRDRDKSLNRRVYWPCSSKSLGCRWIYAYGLDLDRRSIGRDSPIGNCRPCDRPYRFWRLQILFGEGIAGNFVKKKKKNGNFFEDVPFDLILSNCWRTNFTFVNRKIGSRRFHICDTTEKEWIEEIIWKMWKIYNFKIRWNGYVWELLSGSYLSRFICENFNFFIVFKAYYYDRPLGILPLLRNFWNSLVNDGIYTEIKCSR